MNQGFTQKSHSSRQQEEDNGYHNESYLPDLIEGLIPWPGFPFDGLDPQRRPYASTITPQSPAVGLTAFSQVLSENERVFMKDDDDYRY